LCGPSRLPGCFWVFGFLFSRGESRCLLQENVCRMLAISKETERIVSRRCHRGGKRARKTFHLVTHWYTRTTPHRRLPVPPVRRLEPRACLLLVSVPGSPAVLARDSAAVVARAAAEDLRLVEPVMLVGRLAGAVRRFTLVPEGLAGALLLGAVAGA
jgi:hypothetical protein